MPRGGAREGAGHPLADEKLGKKVLFRSSMFKENFDWLTEQAKKEGKSVSAFLDGLLHKARGIKPSKKPVKKKAAKKSAKKSAKKKASKKKDSSIKLTKKEKEALKKPSKPAKE